MSDIIWRNGAQYSDYNGGPLLICQTCGSAIHETMLEVHARFCTWIEDHRDPAL